MAPAAPEKPVRNGQIGKIWTMKDDGARWRGHLDRAAPTLVAVMVLLPAMAINHGRDAERAAPVLGAAPPAAADPSAAATGPAPAAPAPGAPAPGAPSPAAPSAAASAPTAPAAVPVPSARGAAKARGSGVVGQAGPAAVAALERRGQSVVVRWRQEAGHPAAEYCTVVNEQPAGAQTVIDVLVDPADTTGTVRCRKTTRPTRTIAG
jgi:hypothetical protein